MNESFWIGVGIGVVVGISISVAGIGVLIMLKDFLGDKRYEKERREEVKKR